MLHLYVDNYAIEEMFINAVWLTGMSKYEIINDLEKLNFFNKEDLDRVKNSIERYNS